MMSFSPKIPVEIIVVSVNFAAWLAVGETVSTCVVTATDEATGSDLTSSMISGAPDLTQWPLVKQKVQAGTADHNYIIQFQIVSSLGQTFVATVNLPVRSTT